MKKLIMFSLMLLGASGLQAKKLLIKNEGQSSVDVFVGNQKEFKARPSENFINVQAGQTKEFDLGNYLVLGKQGLSQYTILRGQNTINKKPMIRITTNNLGYGASTHELDLEADDNDTITLIIDGYKIKQ